MPTFTGDRGHVGNGQVSPGQEERLGRRSGRGAAPFDRPAVRSEPPGRPEGVPILRSVRRAPDPTSRSVAAGETPDDDSAVPSPAFAFLLTLIALPSLFWLVTLKRTTGHTIPEDWLMMDVVPPIQDWVATNAPLLDAVLVGISGLGSGWFVAAGFAVAGLIALARRRTDLALLLAAGTLAFPIEWALKYFTATDPVISLPELGRALFNLGGTGLDDIADFPAGHALRATVFYGLLAFCIARVSRDRRRGMLAYAIAVGLIVAISLIRLYLGAHYPIDLLGGWMAGGALLAVIVAVYSLAVDYRVPA